nr:hypothetical protein [Clostridia bacterium]
PPEYTMDAEGEVVIEYKVSGAEDNTYTTTKPTALGTYVVRVKFNGNENYTADEDTLEFEITKKNPGLDITNAEDLNVSYGTTLPDPVITKATDATPVVEYKLIDAEDNTYTATKPTDAGIYCIKVSVEEMENFLAGYIIVNFTISKVNNPDPNSVVTPTNIQADYGQTLGDIELPENWYWVDDEQTSVGDVGNNVFAVVYISTNYINIQRNVTVSVNKIDWPMFTTVYDSIDDRDITVDTTGMYPKIKIQAYYGRTLSDFTFPAGWTVMYRAGTVDFSKGHDKAGGTYEQYNCLMATRNGDANHNDTTISHIEIDTYNPYVTLTITDDLSVTYGTSVPSITNDSYTAINQFGGPVYINDLSVEYYVNGQYTSSKPTEIGSYYCKISIPFSVYHNAAYCEKQFVISPKPVYVVDREEEIDEGKAYVYEIKSQYEATVYDVRYTGFTCNSDIETAGIVAGSNTTTKYAIKLETAENYGGLYNNVSGFYDPGTYDLKVSTTINSTYETVVQYAKLIIYKDEVDLSFVDNANVTLIYDSWYITDIFNQIKNKNNFDSEVSNNIYYKYKVFGADDSTYSEDMPEGLGTFVVKAFYDGSDFYEEAESENTCTLVITIGEAVYTYFDGEYTISVNYVYAKTYISVEYLGEFEYDELENENFDNLHLNVYVYDDSIIVEGFEYTITGEHTMEPLDRGEVVYYSQICDGELIYISFNENKSGNKYVFIYWDYELSIEDIMAGEYNYECLERMPSPWYIENGKLYCEVYDVKYSFIIDGEENKFVTLNIGEVQYTYNIDGNTHKFCIVDGVNIEYVYDDEISNVVPYRSDYWTYEPDLKLIGYVDTHQMFYDFDAQLYRYYIFFNEETQKEEVASIDLDFVINYIYYEYAYEYNNELEQNVIMTYVYLFTTDYNERTKDYYECVFDGKHNYTFAEILDICEGDLSEYKTANIWGYDENGDYKILTLLSHPRMYILEDNTICPYQSNTTTPAVDYYYYFDGIEYNDTYIFMSNGLYYCCEGTSILDPENTRYLLIDYGEYELNDDVIFVEGFGYFKVKNGSQKELEIYYGDIEYTYEDNDSNILKFCSIGDEKVCYLSEYNNENEKYYPDYIMYRWEFDEAVQVIYLIKLFEEQELTTLSYYIVGENTLEPTTNILYYGVIEADNNKVWTVVFTKPFENNEEMFYMAQIFEGERVITFAEINDPHVCLECDYWGNYDWDGSSGWLDIYEPEISYSYEKVNNLLVVLKEEHPM